MPALRSDYAEGLRAEAYEYYEESQQYSSEPDHIETLYNVKNTERAWEQCTTVVEDSDPQKREEGAEKESTNPIEGWTAYGRVYNWYKMHEYSDEVIQDHQRFSNILKELTKNWANAFIRGKNKYMMKCYNLGGYSAGDTHFNSAITGNCPDPSGNLIYDLYPFFNLSTNTRARRDGNGANYNLKALTLTPDNFETIWNAMTVDNAFNEDGSEITIEPNAILYGRKLNFAVRRLLESTRIPGSNNNDENVLSRIVEPIQDRYFSDEDGFVLLQTKKDIDFLKRQEPKIEIWYNNKNDMHFISMEERYGHRIKNYRHNYASGLPTSA